MTIKINLTKEDLKRLEELERLSKLKKNPQDATLRNIRALKKRVIALELKVSMLESEAISPAKKKK